MITGVRTADRLPHNLTLARVGLSSLAQLRSYQMAWFASRFTAGFIPDHFMSSTEHWLEPLPEHSRSLRHSDAFRLPRPKKAVLSRSPLYASLSLSLWNSLPRSLCSSSTKEAKAHFLSH